MLHAIPDPSPVTDYIIALTAFIAASAGFLKWVRPVLREVMAVVRKANRVFDVLLQEYEVPDVARGGRASKMVALPEAIVYILEWQTKHDARSPSDADLDRMTR